MIPIVLLGLGLLLVLGVFLGWSVAEASMAQRSRRQARLQQRLNAEWRALGEMRRQHRAGRR